MTEQNTLYISSLQGDYIALKKINLVSQRVELKGGINLDFFTDSSEEDNNFFMVIKDSPQHLLGIGDVVLMSASYEKQILSYPLTHFFEENVISAGDDSGVNQSIIQNDLQNFMKKYSNFFECTSNEIYFVSAKHIVCKIALSSE